MAEGDPVEKGTVVWPFVICRSADGVAVDGWSAGSDCAAVVAGDDSTGGETMAWLSAVCRLAGDVIVAGGDSNEHSSSSCQLSSVDV